MYSKLNYTFSFVAFNNRVKPNFTVHSMGNPVLERNASHI